MGLTATEAAAIARSIVVSLCGGRWVSPPVQFVDEYPVSSQGTVVLSGRPVREVHSVRLGDETVDPSEYNLYNGFVIRFTDPYRARAACRTRTATVDYTYGLDELPAVVESAVKVMTDELAACVNGDECRIPDRVTSVNRQGVSWTLIDPQDFLTDGRTGIYEIDLAIKAFNPRNARRRARVFHPTVSAPALRRKP